MKIMVQYTIAHFLDYFRAIAQALFFKNALFGFLLLLLFAAFDRNLFFAGLIGSLIGHLYSVHYSTPKVLRDWGLITVNGLFFGISMASLFHPSPVFLLCLFLGSFSIPLVTKATFEILQHWRLSCLVVPYMIATWVFWLCSKTLGMALQPQVWPESFTSLPQFHFHLFSQPIVNHFALSVFTGAGRLLFLPNPLFGISILALMLLFSPRRGIYFTLGTLVASTIGFFMSNGSVAWQSGYFSYCAGLVGLGLASFPEKFALRTILLFSAVCCFVTLAVEQLLGASHLPSLTLPYALTLWTALLSQSHRMTMGGTVKAIPYRSPIAAIVENMRLKARAETDKEPSPEIEKAS